MSTLLLVLNQPVVEVIGWTLIHFLWQASLIAVLAAVAMLVLRRSSAHSRYLVLCGAMLLVALCPAVTCYVLAGTLEKPEPVVVKPAEEPLLRDKPVLGPMVVDEFDGVDLIPVAVPSPTQEPVIPTFNELQRQTLSERVTSMARAIAPLLPWVVLAWICGVIGLSCRLMIGWWIVQRWKKRGTTLASEALHERLRQLAEQLNIRRPIWLLESALVDVPTVIGWIRPAILLPAAILTGLTPSQLEAVIAHELAHIRRHDYLVNLLQAVIETLLFYHPAVWWLSHRIRQEREHCCDDIAVSLSGNPLCYAQALATMEQLRSVPALAVAASGGSLVQRIRRLALGSSSNSSESTPWGASLIAITAIVTLSLVACFSVQIPAEAQPPASPFDKRDVPEEKSADVAWGPEVNGLRCRLVAVSPSMNAESPAMSPSTDTFATPSDMTFVVELNNVSQKPITLLGIRYGQSYAGAAGKLNMEFLAPHLFDFAFTDSNGKPVHRPSRAYGRDMLILSGASAHEVAPGQSLRLLLRPSKFSVPMDYQLTSGSYSVKVRYLGIDEKVRDEIKKHWPDYPQTRAWTQPVVSNDVSFKITSDEKKPVKLDWGPVKDGLQAAIEFQITRPTDGSLGVSGIPTQVPGVPVKTRIGVVFHVKNVSDKVITFASETGRQGDTIHVTNEEGKEIPLHGAWFSGWPVMVRWTLKPGEVARLNVLAPPLAEITEPGRYFVWYTIRFNSMKSSNFPLKDDWQSELDTGETQLFLRPRTADDDAREKPPTFTSRVEFLGTNGQKVEKGTMTFHGAVKHESHAAITLHPGAIEIPECTAAGATIVVRAEGFEEAYFRDVVLKADMSKTLELVPAKPTRFKLVSSKEDRPIAGARIRFFNKTSALASSGPVPMHGLEGPVWTTSGPDGTVILNSLQRIDPYYKDLGDAVYYFCIEFPDKEIPSRVIGPIKAGQDLGTIRVGPPLEVRGEIHGTLEELKRFAAEWDQPVEMRTDNPDATWDYAVSKRLETVPDGDRLKFHLTGLTPGRLRFVCNFGPHPHSVTHTYGRRDPKGSDIVVTIDVQKSMDDLILTPNGQKKAVDPDANKGAAAQKVDDSTVVGTVVTPDDQPAAGVTISAFQGERLIEKSIVSDDQGRFRVPKAWRSADHFLTLVAHRGRDEIGWFDFFVHGHSNQGQKTEDGSFRLVLLPLNQTVSGKLIDQNGKPLSGVPVNVEFLNHVVNQGSPLWHHFQIGNRKLFEPAITKQDGSYSMKLPAGSTAMLNVQQPEWAHCRISGATQGGIYPTAQLTPAAKVAGRVIISKTGRPASGVTIAAQALKPDFQSGGWGSAVTDAEGRYEIGGLAAGQYNVMVMETSDGRLTSPAHTGLDMKSAETAVADFALIEGRRLHGRVLSADTNQPVVGCTVSYYGPSRPSTTGATLSAVTNEQGEFELFVPPGPSHVYVAEMREESSQSTKDLEVPANRDPEAIELKVGHRLQDGLKIFLGPARDRLVSLDADKMPLSDAIKSLCDQAGTTLELSAYYANDSGIDNVGRDESDDTANAVKRPVVTASLKSVKLHDALTTVLKQSSNLGFKIVENKVVVHLIK